MYSCAGYVRAEERTGLGLGHRNGCLSSSDQVAGQGEARGLR